MEPDITPTNPEATVPPAPLAEQPTLPPQDAVLTSAYSESASAPRNGAAVPGYEILRELGRGGMGVVYQARHTKLDRVVALKMILAGGHAGEADLARFKTEAESVARLQHPHIVQIFEVGEHGGLPFFSLEYCPGGSLDKKLKGTPLPPKEAAALVEKLARAMQAAHAKGIVHRDLKPANVLLAEDGEPKITDFGLAKKLDAAAGQTRTGAVMGTPSYMAPEQAGGKTAEIGPLCDVYALGAILYECLTGRPPFKAATALDTMMQVVADDPVPPRQLQSKTPRDLETICLRCLRKEPVNRYASAAALAEDLRRFRGGEPIRARPVGRLERVRKWARRRPALAALLLVTVLGVAGIVWKYLDAEQQKAEALRETAKANKARDFLASMFRFSETDIQPGDITAGRILAAAEKRIPEEFADQPQLRDELLAGIRRLRLSEVQKNPYAMILDVRGTVELQSTVDPNQRAAPQTLLYDGDRLTVGADGQVQLVILSDLHKERLQPGWTATVSRKGCNQAVRERNQDPMMTFVRLPKGTFYMGYRQYLMKGVKTEIREDFEIAVHDVTQGQWQAVMGDNPSYFSRFGGGQNEVMDISDLELKLFPVESVSWDDAQAFIKKLNEQNPGSGYLYRLPTEAEWEYAARGGATSEEECSYDYYLSHPTNNLSSVPWEQANFSGEYNLAPKGKGRTTRVGAYYPNKLGLCDMYGNVWQWCTDVYDVKEKAGFGATTVGLLGSPFGQGPFLAVMMGGRGFDNRLLRVLRGGSWREKWIVPASFRAGGFAASGLYDQGLRMVRVPRPASGPVRQSERPRSP